MSRILSFYEFIYDRHLIWHKRNVLKQPAPWTDDPVLSQFKSCNVYRFLDKGSQYPWNRFLSKTNLLDEEKFFNTYVYRIFNLYNLFDGVLWDDILYPYSFNFKQEEARLDAIKAAGKTMYSDAYTITQTIWNKEYGKPGKHIQVLLGMQWLAERIETVLADFKACPGPMEQIESLREIPMVGPFLAGQMHLDLGYCGISKFTNNDWLVVGPGAKAGLEIIWDKTDLKYDEQVACTKKLALQQEVWFRELKEVTGKDWKSIAYSDLNWPYLSLMDIQNSLCEFRKYWNINKALKDKSFKCKLRYYETPSN